MRELVVCLIIVLSVTLNLPVPAYGGVMEESKEIAQEFLNETEITMSSINESIDDPFVLYYLTQADQNYQLSEECLERKMYLCAMRLSIDSLTQSKVSEYISRGNIRDRFNDIYFNAKDSLDSSNERRMLVKESPRDVSNLDLLLLADELNLFSRIQFYGADDIFSLTSDQVFVPKNYLVRGIEHSLATIYSSEVSSRMYGLCESGEGLPMESIKYRMLSKVGEYLWEWENWSQRNRNSEYVPLGDRIKSWSVQAMREGDYDFAFVFGEYLMLLMDLEDLSKGNLTLNEVRSELNEVKPKFLSSKFYCEMSNAYLSVVEKIKNEKSNEEYLKELLATSLSYLRECKRRDDFLNELRLLTLVNYVDPPSISELKNFLSGREFLIVVGSKSAITDLEKAKEIREVFGGRIVDDSEVSEEEMKKYDLIIVGGPAANRIAMKVNPVLRAYFLYEKLGETSKWVLRTPAGLYSMREDSTIQIMRNPENPSKILVLAAGITRVGTSNAVDYLLKGRERSRGVILRGKSVVFVVY